MHFFTMGLYHVPGGGEAMQREARGWHGHERWRRVEKEGASRPAGGEIAKEESPLDREDDTSA
jgi:hypothetical protein